MFHADPSVVGRGFRVAPDVYTVVGVMPPDFEFPDGNTEMWIPLHVTADSGGLLQVAALLRPGVTVERARGALAVVSRQLEQDDPKRNAGTKFEVLPWTDEPARNYQLTLLFILAAVGLVLLIACSDAGGLLLGRAAGRQKEMAIRASLGAGTWRVMRQSLAESLVLAAAGGTAGVALAHYALAFLVNRLAALPIVLPHMRAAAINGRVAVFSAVLCLLTACFFSLGPAAVRLPHGSAGGAARRPGRPDGALLTAIRHPDRQPIGICFSAAHGFGTDDPQPHSPGAGRPWISCRPRTHLARAHWQHARGIRSAVSHAAAANGLPARTAAARGARARSAGRRGGRNNPPLSGVNTAIDFHSMDGRHLPLATRTISPRYFAAMGIPLLSGRAFTEADQTGAPGVVIVNRTLARHLFGIRDPVGLPLPEDRSGR